MAVADQAVIQSSLSALGDKLATTLLGMSSEPACKLELDAKTDLGESPVWDARTQRLYFVDINGQKLHIFEEKADPPHRTIKFSTKVGTVAPLADANKVLVAFDRTVVVVDVGAGAATDSAAAGEPSVATVPEDHGMAEMRFNDGKASPAGVFVVGRMHNNWRGGENGRLYWLDWTAGSGGGKFVETLSPEEVCLPNGMAWDVVKEVMYFVDSATRTITAYKADPMGIPLRAKDGTFETRVVATVPKEEGTPDGMTIDKDGNLWVALADGGAVACYSSASGEQLRKVTLPVKRPTACTFGGENLEKLYVTTRVETGEGASENWGGLFSVEIPGVFGAAPAYIVHSPVL